MAAEDYDYGELLAKVDSSIAQSSTAAAPVGTGAYRVSSEPDFPSKPAFGTYVKSEHTVLRLYRSQLDLISLPKSIFVMAFSVFFQLFLTMELINAGLDGGGTWLLGIFIWQPVLLTTNHLLQRKLIPYCWPVISVIVLVFVIIWDIARSALLPNVYVSIGWAALTIATNFAVEFPVLFLRHKFCWQVGAGPARSRSDFQPQERRAVGMPPAVGGGRRGSGGFVPPVAPAAGAGGMAPLGGMPSRAAAADLEVAGDL